MQQNKVPFRQKKETGGCGTFCIANLLNKSTIVPDEEAGGTTIFQDTQTLRDHGGEYFADAYFDQAVALPANWGRIPTEADDLFTGRGGVHVQAYRVMLLTVLPVGAKTLHRVLLVADVMPTGDVWIVDSTRERIWKAKAGKMLEKYRVQGIAVMRSEELGPMQELLVYEQHVAHIVRGGIITGGITA